MAVAATMLWNHDISADPTKEGATNGGGFNPSRDAVNGIDYSTGARSPVVTGTDLACSDHTGPPFTVTSASGGFTAAIVDNYLTISTTGTSAHFVVGTYLITSYVDANTITLNTDPTDGTNEVAGTYRTGGYKAFSDLACVDTTTTLTSAIGGFTHAMEGNVIYIASGTNFHAEVGTPPMRFEIVTYTDANTVTLDRAPNLAGSNASAGVGYVGGAMCIVNGTNLSLFRDDVDTGGCPGVTHYWKSGTYAITTAAVVSTRSGTAALTISDRGYHDTKGDACNGADRPIIASNSYGYSMRSWWRTANLIITGTAAAVWGIDAGSIAINCAIFNTSTTANRSAAMYTSSGGVGGLVNCEVSSPVGYAFNPAGGGLLCRCYIHDCAEAVHLSGYNSSWPYLDTIIATCSSKGIAHTAQAGPQIRDCTFYDCATGIRATTGGPWFVENCIFSDAATEGLTWTTEQLSNRFDHNNFHGNTSDATNATQLNKTTYDPAFQGETLWTDLYMDSANNKIVKRAAGGFSTYFGVATPGKAGLLHIIAGTSWTPGYYQILSVDSDTQMTLNTSPAAVNVTGGQSRVCLDFRLGTSSDCLGAGVGISLGVGAASTVDQGAWQQAAGGGGLLVHPGMAGGMRS